MAARVTRGKRKIVTAGIPFGVPGASALPERLGGRRAGCVPRVHGGLRPRQRPGPPARRPVRGGRAARAGHPRTAPGRAGAAGAARAAAPPALPPGRPGRRRRAARPAARPGPLAVAPRRGRRGPRPASGDAGSRHLAARRELPSPGLRGGRARDGGRRHPTPAGTGSASTTRPWSRSTRRRPSGWRRRSRWPSGTVRGRVCGRSTTSTARCRTATGSRRCVASCSPGPVSRGRPWRRSTWRSGGAATTSSASTSPVAATSSRETGGDRAWGAVEWPHDPGRAPRAVPRPDTPA